MMPENEIEPKFHYEKYERTVIHLLWVIVVLFTLCKDTQTRPWHRVNLIDVVIKAIENVSDPQYQTSVD